MSTVTTRSYVIPDDFKAIGDFLIANYQPGNRDGNWLQPTWEYMHSHSSLDESSFGKIGVWEDAEKIVGVAHYESVLGEAFFEIHPDYTYLKPAMLAYAEEHLSGKTDGGHRYVKAFINDFDQEFEAIAASNGYAQDEHNRRPMSQMRIPQPFPEINLQEGFRLKSLQEDNDLRRIHRVLWRGFDHPGEPPEEGIQWRLKMQSVPGYRRDLKIVVEAPGGDFVSFCGMWYDPINRICVVEPVATDPNYRRMGLGKAAVLEGVRRCGALGATVAYVGSDQKFYEVMGFEKIYTSYGWAKQF